MTPGDAIYYGDMPGKLCCALCSEQFPESERAAHEASPRHNRVLGGLMPNSTRDNSATLGNLAAALALAQSEIRAAEKDRENPFFKSDYSTLAAVWTACRDALGKNGLSVVQVPMLERAEGATPERLVLMTYLIHKSGEWMRSRYPVNPTKNDPQGIGSAVTYARRYSLAAMVGVYSADDDDDGNAASGRDAAPAKREPPRNVAELKQRASEGRGQPQPPGAKAAPAEPEPPGPCEILPACMRPNGHAGECVDKAGASIARAPVSAPATTGNAPSGQAALPASDDEFAAVSARTLIEALKALDTSAALKKWEKKNKDEVSWLKMNADTHYKAVIAAWEQTSVRVGT